MLAVQLNGKTSCERSPWRGLDDLGRLNTGEWDALHDLVDRFEESWHRSDEVDLADFLPAPGEPLRSPTLIELIRTDLELRWCRGRPIFLEDYLDRFPELGTADDLPPQLIFEEYRARRRMGNRPELTAYAERFPAQYPALLKLTQEQPIPTPGPGGAAVATPPSHFPPLTTSENDSLLPVGSYRLLGRLGSGGFGEVSLAEAPGGIKVAIKTLYWTLDHEEAQRELGSLELLKQLSHPFLLQTQQFWVLDKRLYVVMELAEGSLRDRYKAWQNKELPGISLPELLRFFRESAEAIDYLHSEHILHRDIKPDNILLLKGHAKVADFGLARAHQQPTVSVSGSGTPAYMAPEVWHGKASEQSDLYAFALTYVEMRLGHRPFGSNDYMGVMIDHLETPPDLTPLGPAERQVLLQALSKHPYQRQGSCQAFVQELEQALVQDEALPAALGALSTPPPVPPSGTDELLRAESRGGRFDTLAPAKESPSVDKDVAVSPQPPQELRPRVLIRRVVLGGLAATLLAALAGWFLTLGRKVEAPSPAPPDPKPIAEELIQEFPLKVEMIGSRPSRHGRRQLMEGQEVSFRIEMDREAYVGLWVVRPDRTIVQLFPNRFEPDNRFSPGVRTIPDPERRYAIEAVASEGPEHVWVIATTRPWKPLEGEGPFPLFKTPEEREKVKRFQRDLRIRPEPSGELNARVDNGFVAEEVLHFQVAPRSGPEGR